MPLKWWALSLTVHALIGALLWGLYSQEPKPQASTVITVMPVAEPSRQDPLKPDVSWAMDRQVVSNDPELPEKKTPPETRLLSDKDTWVEKQQKAKQTGVFRNVKSKPTALWQKLAPGWSFQKPNDFNQNTPPNENGNSGDYRLGASGDRDPSSVSATLDYLPDVPEGWMTQLNTRSWAYASFYNRIKQQLGPIWISQVEALTHHPEVQVFMATRGRYVTRTILTIDARGYVHKISIIGSEAFAPLDKAVLQAVELAQPFRNPPRELMDDSGYIRIRWDFIVHHNDEL